MALRDIVTRAYIASGAIHKCSISLIPRVFFKKNTPDSHLYIYYNYHIDSEMVMSHFRIPSVLNDDYILLVYRLCLYVQLNKCQVT